MPAKIVITGAAGLVGQNLLPRLKARGHTDIVAIDKHAANIATLRRLHPDIAVIETDLAHADGWQSAVRDADILIVLHAQIGGLEPAAFTDNNIVATERLIDAVRARPPYVIHVGTSAVHSAVTDWYTESKKAQQRLLLESGLPVVVLEPTLMFGWFDRKHLGWLARFMRRVPVFPIPGHGRYLRQPLYAGDFCNVIMACVEQRPVGKTYSITGLEKIDYIDLIRAIREACGARTPILRIPYSAFWLLLAVYGLVDRNAPFTTKQLKALTTPDIFEVIDWPGLFGVRPTPLREALHQTFNDPVYSEVVLEF